MFSIRFTSVELQFNRAVVFFIPHFPKQKKPHFWGLGWGGEFWKGQKLICGMFFRPLTFHLRLACGPGGGILLRGDALDLETLSGDASSPAFE
jgi:hypothetical protein